MKKVTYEILYLRKTCAIQAKRIAQLSQKKNEKEEVKASGIGIKHFWPC